MKRYMYSYVIRQRCSIGLSAASVCAFLAFSAQAADAAPVCIFGTVPCFVACSNPPRIHSDTEAEANLRLRPFDGLTRFDRVSAALTTQLGKCLGINGWRKYRLRPFVVGTVVQTAKSWDGLETVDLEIEEFDAESVHAPPAIRSRYLRVEIIRKVWKRFPKQIRPGDRLRISGGLHWDGHGFLEIHPSGSCDVQRLPSRAKLTIDVRIGQEKSTFGGLHG